MITTIKRCDVQRLEILNEKGVADERAAPRLTAKQLKEIYRWMLITREFDDRAVKLQRTGRMGTVAHGLGQEATIIGTTYALRKQDWLVPSFRINGGILLRGVPVEQFYSYWGGDERGSNFKDANIFPVGIEVGSWLPHAVGLAWAFKLQKKDAVVLADFGDGATSTGDFHEALNFASVFKVPVIFVCQNNKWAISVPISQQTGSETIAQKGLAYDINCIQVDGNDVLAMYQATQDAIKEARKGRPTLIEADTYRRESHTTSDEWKRYRPEKEVKGWEKKDPILRLQLYLEKKKILTKKEDEKIRNEVVAFIDKGVKKYESLPLPPKEDIYKYILAEGVK